MIQIKLLNMSVLMCVLISLHLTASIGYGLLWFFTDGTEGKCHKFKCSATLQSRSKSTRIIGGMDAMPNEFPHQIYFRRPQLPPVFCGGSVLNEKYVLSAAHCFYNKDTSVFSAIAGGHNIEIRSEKEQVRQLKKVTLHEDYDHPSSFNDISIVEVDPPFDLADNNIVRQVVLPQPNYVSSGDFVVTGWGTQREHPESPQPDILQKVTVPLITNQECTVAYGGRISPTMLCAGYLGVGGKDACHGDSGGPLALKMANGSYLLVGVVSWGYGCAKPNFPGVYTEVAKFLDWIHDNTGP